MSKLCKRLGDFASAETAPPLEKLQPEPVSEVNLDEWHEYQAERIAAQKTAPEDTGLRVRQEALRARHTAERKRILPRVARRGLPALNKTRHQLKVRQQKEWRTFRQSVRPAPSPRPRFETWLRGRGLHVQADRWRHRKGLEAAPKQPVKEHIMPQTPLPENQLFERYIAAVNGDRVRITCIRMDKSGGKKAFVLDKQNGMSKGFTPEEVQAHMPEMLRLQQRGENIYYTPLSEGRHHILIDDMTRESLEKLYADGFRPAVVLESSPGNYQCVLTIPKLQSPNTGGRMAPFPS